MIRTLGMVACAGVLAFTATTATTFANEGTIVDVASGNDDFSTLVEFVVAAELVDTLAGTGPFTVFAPTNDAFAAMPAFVGEVLTANPDLLNDILLYHVVPGSLMATDVLAAETLTTANEEMMRVSTADGNAFVDASTIILTDVEADNGVIHAIDTVLLPNTVYQAVIDMLRAELTALEALFAAKKGSTY